MTYRLVASFNRSDAWELCEQLAAESSREVSLDFSRVRDVSDLGLAILAGELLRANRTVRVRGLRDQQIRVLHYCGLDVEAGDSPDAMGAEERFG